jgi:hypothetical protein
MILTIEQLMVLMLVIFTVLSLLFIFLIINKAQTNRFASRVDKMRDLLRDRLFLYLYEKEGTAAVVPKDQVSFQALESLLHDVADVSDSDDIRGAIQTYAEKHFSPVYKQKLLHTRWAIRMNVLFAVEKFHIGNMTDDILAYYERKKLTSSEESQILKILIKMDHPNLIDYILQPKTKLSELVFRSLIGMLSDKQGNRFVEAYETMPSELKWPLLEMMGRQKKAKYVPFLMNRLSSEEEEERIRALKSLASIGKSIPLETIKPHAASLIWEERMMAVKLLGISDDSNVLPLLEPFMSDPQFAVRSQAAQSILAFEGGKDMLLELYVTAEDNYAKDMAAQWLEKEAWRDVI